MSVTESRELPTQFRSTRGLAMLPAATFETRNRLSTLSLEMPTQKAERILKYYNVLIYENTHDIINLFCKNVLKKKGDTLAEVVNFTFFISASYYHQYILIGQRNIPGRTTQIITRVLIHYAFCVLKFHVTRMQTKFCRSCSHHRKGCAGLM